MAGGRPTKYNPSFCDKVEKLGKLGKSQEQIAACLGVDPKSLRDWAESHPEFSLSLTRAKNFELQWWEDAGQNALFADRFQQQVWSKSMSCRFKDKYTERSINEHGGIGGKPMEHKLTVDTESSRSALVEALAKAGITGLP